MQKHFLVVIVVIFGISSGLLYGSGILEPLITVSSDSGEQGWPQVAYNHVADEYLVVWEDYRRTGDWSDSDIYGQFVGGDGVLKGVNVPICSTSNPQYWPVLAYDFRMDRYLIVFQDYRNGNDGDIYGIFFGSNGEVQPVDSSEADGAFPISKNPGGVYIPAVSYNYSQGIFLAVWQENRNGTADIYGQRIRFDGELLPAPGASDSKDNFPIDNNVDFHEGVPDVGYNPMTDEWFVVYAREVGNNNSSILGRRINHDGNFVNAQGTPAATPPVTISEQTGNGPDGAQVRVQFNTEPGIDLNEPGVRLSECLIVWNFKQLDARDIHGQRVAFLSNPSGNYETTFIDSTGEITSPDRSNFPVSNAEGNQAVCSISYSMLDNEFLTGWGDARSKMWSQQDLYCQRLQVQPDSAMLWLNEDQSTEITPNMNFPVDTTDAYEGNLVCSAHNSKRNEFLFVYTYKDVSGSTGGDLYARRISGTIPTSVKSRDSISKTNQFEIISNYPNPFNPATHIRYTLPASGHIRIYIVDLLGRRVRTLYEGYQQNELHTILWDGMNDSFQPVASGVYIVRIEAKNTIRTKKVTLIR